nr:hypothetical protein [Syntrophomonadaceae bacterium]
MIQMMKPSFQLAKSGTSHQSFAAKIRRKYARAGLLGWRSLSLIFRSNSIGISNEDVSLQPFMINIKLQFSKLREQKNALQTLQKLLFYQISLNDKPNSHRRQETNPQITQSYLEWNKHISNQKKLGASATSSYRQITPYIYPTPQFKRQAKSGSEREIIRYLKNRVQLVEQSAALWRDNWNYADRSKPQSKTSQKNRFSTYEQRLYPATDIYAWRTGKSPMNMGIKPGDAASFLFPLTLQTIYNEKEGSAAKAEQKIEQLVQQLLLWQVIKGQEARNLPVGNGESIINQYPAQIPQQSVNIRHKLLKQRSNRASNYPLFFGKEQIRGVEPVKRQYDKLQSLLNQEAAKANIALTVKEKQALRSRQLNRNYPVNQWGFKEQAGLTAPVIGKTGHRSDILSLMIYLKPSIFKQYMMGRQTAPVLSDYPLKTNILNSNREKLTVRLIRESIKEQSSLKPWAGTNKNRARQSSFPSPFRAGIMPDKSGYPGSSGREIGSAAQTGISNYLNINPYLYLTPQYRRRAESGREREMARYIENRMPFSEQTAGLKRNNRNYETRPQSIKIKQQTPIAFHEQNVYTVPYTPNTMVTGRVPVHRAVKPGDFNTYSLPPLQTNYMEKEGSAAQAEQKIVQLVQQLLLWQVIKDQEARNQPVGNGESIINQYPAQLKKKSINRQQKFITQSRSKETNAHLLVGRVQVRGVNPVKRQYDKLQSLVNKEAAKANIALTVREKQALRSRQLNRNYPVNQLGFKEQPDLTASVIGKNGNRSDILSLMIYLKPSIFKQYMMGRKTAPVLSDYPLKTNILNSKREKLTARLIKESIKEQSSLKPWAGTNENRARQSSVQSPLRAGIMPNRLSYPGSSGREFGSAAQTGISNYLNINPYIYLTPQYRKRAESGREREIATYIEKRVSFSEQIAGLKHNNQNYETRQQSIKIKQQAPIASHEQNVYTVPYTPNTMETGRVP